MTNETIGGLKRLSEQVGGDDRWDVNITGGNVDNVTIDGATITNSSIALSSPLNGASGGTGVANTGKTITLGGNLVTTGAFTLTMNLTATTTLTLPTSGTIITSANKISDLAATTSSELAGKISDETGSGSLVFANTPTLVTPVLGVATATSINKVLFTAPATSATLTIADGKTLTASNTLTFTGTDSSSVAFGTGGTVAYTGGNLSQFAATTSAQLAGVISDETGSGSLVFGTSPTLGGTVIVDNMQTSGSSGIALKNSGGTTVVTFGSTNTTNVSFAGAVNATTFNGVALTTGGSSTQYLNGAGSYATITNPIKAWVNFNGTGTVAIRASSNVSSITDNGTGDYTVNFSSALADADYCAHVTLSGNFGTNAVAYPAMYNNGTTTEQAPTTSAFRFRCFDGSGNVFDCKYVMATVVGN